MKNRKRGLRNKDEVNMNFFKSKLILDSFKSKIAFLFIVLMFGVVISIGIFDIYGGNYSVNFGESFGENVNGDVNIDKLSNAIAEHLNGCG